MKNEDAEVLVTGATGLIGRWLLAALTARGRRVVAVVRNAPEREAELRAFVRSLGGDDGRLAVVSGDVESTALAVSERLDGVQVVYHLAARFAFGMKPEEARRANVEGTLNTLEWAHARPALRRFVYLGGYRMTRLPPALAAARFPLDAAASRRLYREHGAYEGSKYESSLAFRQFVQAHDLPWTAVHPSGVIGDSRTGETTQLVGLGETVERLWEGRLPALVGTARTFLPVVPVDYLASFLATVAEREETRGQDLTVLDATTPALPELIRGIAAHLHVDPPRGILPKSLVRALPTAVTGVEKETLGFLSEDRYDTASAEAHARAVGLVWPDARASVARWGDYLVSTRFTADPSAERGALREGAFTVGDPTTAEIVYLHGLPWNGDAWKPVADRVGRSAARLDLAGFGRSAPTRLADAPWLSRALEGRADPVVLVGHSIGAAMAVRYAHAHPEKVRSLVLVAPAFLQRRPSAVMRVSPLVALTLRRATPERLSARLLGEEAQSRPLLPAVRSASIDLRRRGVASRVARALAAVSSPRVRRDLQRQLAELRCPVVLVHGADDPLVVQHSVAASAVVTIASAGHAVHLTHVEEVARAVTAALMPRPRRAALDASTRA